MGNNLKTAFLLTVLTLFLIFAGGAIGGASRFGASNGMILAFVLAAMFFVAWMFFRQQPR